MSSFVPGPRFPGYEGRVSCRATPRNSFVGLLLPHSVGLSDVVYAVVGIDQGTFLPSVSWLIGLRTAEGFEFGVGPNVSLDGAALAFAAGVTQRVGSLSVPFNIAIVPARTDVRMSFTLGFNAPD